MLPEVATIAAQNHVIRSCWPLPGHWSRYRETLAMLLGSLPEGFSDRQQIANSWAERGLVETPSAALRQLQFLATLTLVDLRVRPLTARRSDAGTDYLAQPSDEAVLQLLRSHVYGVSEILMILEDGFQGRISELVDELRTRFDVPWASDWQARFRLNWLRGFGAVEQLSEAQSIGRYPEWRIRERTARSRR